MKYGRTKNNAFREAGSGCSLNYGALAQDTGRVADTLTRAGHARLTGTMSLYFGARMPQDLPCLAPLRQGPAACRNPRAGGAVFAAPCRKIVQTAASVR